MIDDRLPRRDRIAFLGHSTVHVELDGEALLTDPLLRDRVAHLRRYAQPPAQPRVSAVLLSHAHQDHLDVPSLRMLGTETRMLVPPGAGAWLRKRGFSNVRELEEGEEDDLGAVTIAAVPAEHAGHRYPLGPRSASVGYVVRGSKTVYFAGDTGVFERMAELRGRLDVALLPVAGWGRTLGPGHMDPLDAARAARLLGARIAIPIHWGTFRPIGRSDRGLTIGDGPAREFAAHVGELEPASEVRILAPGQETEL